MSDTTIKETHSQNILQQIEKFLPIPNCKPTKLVIMTIGNVLLSDDGVGPMIYQELISTGLHYPSLLLINAEISPENYLKTIIDFNPSHVIIIDAIESGLDPGTIFCFKNDEVEDKLFLQSSTHMISVLNLNNYLLDKIEKLQILNIGIQVKNTDFGFQLIDYEVYESAIILKDYLTKILLQHFKKQKTH